MKKTTILIVDDHKLVRNSLALMFNLDPHFEVLGECSCGEEGVQLATALQPDIIFMDVNLPNISGMEATSQIVKCNPQARIIGLSMHANIVVARKMLSAGAKGYVTKNASKAELVTAINEVLNKKIYISQEIKQKLTDELVCGDPQEAGMKKLTESELNVVRYLKEGFTSKEIAATLNNSTKTIEVHRYNILKKLQLSNVASLVNYANNSMFLFK